MSRSVHTDPLVVQATRLPAWSVTSWHRYACRFGDGPCTLIDPWCDVDGPPCVVTVRYARGCAGGTRRGQGRAADVAEGATRTAQRAALVEARKAVNAALRAGDVDGLDEVDVAPRRRSISRDLW
jgi:hypothetical protein